MQVTLSGMPCATQLRSTAAAPIRSAAARCAPSLCQQLQQLARAHCLPELTVLARVQLETCDEDGGTCMFGTCLGECTLHVGKLIGIIIGVLIVCGGGGVALMMSQSKPVAVAQPAQPQTQVQVGGAQAAPPPQMIQTQPQLQMQMGA